MNEKPVETGIRIKLDQRQGHGDVNHSLTIDNTDMSDSGEIKAVANNKAGEATTLGKLTVEG